MMKNNKKQKSVKFIISILITCVIAGGFWYVIQNVGNRDFLKYKDIGGNVNVEALNQLNAEWVMPEDYSLDIFEVDKITMEWMQKKGEKPDKAILQLHGGAYIHSLDYNGTTYRRSASQYVKISGAGVLTVDYRVAPENPYPAALEDALLAYDWLLEQGYQSEQIIIVGDSAGGGLTLATVLYLRDHEMPMPAALITMSAWTNLNYRRNTPSYVGENNSKDPYISPIYGKYDGFPPMLMQAGGDEILLRDTIKVAKKANDAGVSVQQTTYSGMFHVFQMLFPVLDEANTAWEEVEVFINYIYGK